MTKSKKKGFLHKDRTVIAEKIKEAFLTVMPITLIVLLLCFTITPIDSGLFLAFIIGALLVTVGTGLFSLGADVAMTPIGQYVSVNVIKTKKAWIIMPVYFIVGVLITISEPDLQVLASRLYGTIGEWVLLIAIGVGVGVFLVIAFLRMILKIKLSYVLVVCYIIVFVLSFFVPECFVPLAFDSGGVTTGPMSVPFIIAIGTGLATIRTDSSAEDDSFGLTALCSIGPIIAVMILGIIFQPDEIKYVQEEMGSISSSSDVAGQFIYALPHYLKDVGIALLPIVCFFFITMIFGGKISGQSLVRILIGVLYTYVGLTIFLLGVEVGFLPIGNEIGMAIAQKSYAWLIIPLGALMGFFVVLAEPAVHVLTKQVYEITGGAIPTKMLSVSLMIGTAISVALAMTRIVLNIPIMYFLIPGYAIALILSFIVPKVFTGIAFDAGGVASGAMTAGFIMPLALGFCYGYGQNIATQGFGVVAMVAMTPLITIQVLGVVYKVKLAKLKKKQTQNISDTQDIIE